MSKEKVLISFILMFLIFPLNVFARSGCCSHHGGVCGCKSSRVTCCDGSYSPSCTCKGGETIIDEDEGFKIKL